MRGREKRAVALQYEKNTPGAPRVSAKGRNGMAEKIEKAARESGIPIMDIPGLAESLYNVEIGEEIPEEFYGITAEILNFVYSLEEKE